MKLLKILLSISILLFTSCINHHTDYKFEYETIITDTPANLEKLNTAYDDYNSDLPYPAASFSINFSTNRASSGGNFNIISKIIEISYHKEDDIVNFSFPANEVATSYQNKLLPLINTAYDEYGPYSFGDSKGWDYFFYANNEGGNFNIKYVYTPRLDWETYNGLERLYGPYNASFINSDHDDLYPAINKDTSKIYFCSNRENNLFHIYSADLNKGSLLYETLAGQASLTVAKDAVLSGNSNDKCPSITRNLMVFTSDREGGYGGFDLYYSLFTNGQWTTPVNFGEKINSANDEYRPITFSFNNIDMMIFSSNRPGGKGGFDLYGVKIGDLIE
jgi:hypothetical protein